MMEAEYVACYEVISQALWLRSFIGLRVVDSISRPLRIYCDDLATVCFSKNSKRGSRNKHIDIKYLVVIEKIKMQDVSIEHIITELM